jgi:PAS domain S-box-containing protein
VKPDPDIHPAEHTAPEVSERLLRLAVEASDLALWDWDLASGDVWVDRRYCSFLGLEERDHIMHISTLSSMVHEDDRELFSKAASDALRGRTPRLQASLRVRHADGRWVWIEVRGSVTDRDANGRVTRMIGTQANVTEEKQLERALANTLRVLQALLETLPMPVILRDADRNVTLVNAAWEHMMATPRKDIIGRRLDADPDRPVTRNHRESDDEVLTHRRSVRYETTVHAADGAKYDIIVAKTPLVAEDGTITGIASVVTDISDQKRNAAVLERARCAAEAAVQAKSRFLANISHELRTPLNGVVGMASLLENTPLDAKQRRFVQTLRSSAESLITLINDVLDISKAEAGKLELSVASMDLRQELEQVVGLFAARAHAKGIELAAHIARDVPAAIEADSMRLRQVLGNLINNAVKFTEHGAVLVSVAVVPGDGELQLEFSVRDTGVGIAPEVHHRIFEAFEQADGSVTRKFGGTGLGLAIARQMVELMRGSMHVESAPGEGSRFSFRVPAGVARGGIRAVNTVPGRAALVIGLHPLVRDAVDDALSTDCATIACTNTPAEAVTALPELLAAARPVRVVVDAAVAGNLAETAAALRHAAGGADIEIIALIAPDADLAPPPGVQRCLVKPLITADLCRPPGVAELPQNAARIATETGRRGRVLVVEDNAVNQEMARAMIDLMGFDVVTASNGLEGVQAAAGAGFTLILMDCQMPVMDGLAAARAIRAAETAGRRVPIIALTGNAMPGDREACLAAGMDDYLAKPFSLTALKTVVERWAGGGAGARRAS